MKSTTRLSVAFSFLATSFLFVGCASDCGCNTGLFGGRILQNQPVRSTIRSWFQGDSCDTCNPAAGMITTPNVAPGCATCAGGLAPVTGDAITQPLYGAPIGNGAQLDAPNLAPSPGPAGGGMGVDSNPPSGL